MKRKTLTPGQRIARRVMDNFYGNVWDREERIAAAIDRAIKTARLQLTGSAANPYRKARPRSKQ